MLQSRHWFTRGARQRLKVTLAENIGRATIHDIADISGVSQELAASLCPVVPVTVSLRQLDSEAATDEDARSVIRVPVTALKPTSSRNSDARRAAQHIEPFTAVVLRYQGAALRDVVTGVTGTEAQALDLCSVTNDRAKGRGVDAEGVTQKVQCEGAARSVGSGIVDDGKMKVRHF